MLGFLPELVASVININRSTADTKGVKNMKRATMGAMPYKSNNFANNLDLVGLI